MENNIFELFDTSDCVSNMLTHTEPEVYPEVIRTEDYTVLYNRTKNTLCGIGQNRVKRLLAAKQKEGDEIAGLYRAVLDAESSCAYYIMYMGNRRYGERYYSGYCTYIELLLKSCLQYNQLHPATPVTIEYKPWRGAGMDSLLFFELPGMLPVLFYVYYEDVQQHCLQLHEKEWDGKVNGNYAKIEEAVMTRYAADILQKRKQIECNRRKMSCVSPGNLLTPYDDVSQALKLINMQDTSGRHITMNDVYQACISYTLTPTYVLPHGMYVIHIQDKTWPGKLYESVLRYLHHELRTRDWYVWAALSAVDNRIDVIAYIPPIFNTEVEAKANIAVIYSKVMLAIVDYLDMNCSYILRQHVINVDCANSNWEASYSSIMLNGAFNPGPLFPQNQFDSDEDYHHYIFKKSGLVNPNYKLCFFPPDPTEITTHDDIDIAKWIEERARGLYQ